MRVKTIRVSVRRSPIPRATGRAAGGFGGLSARLDKARVTLARSRPR